MKKKSGLFTSLILAVTSTLFISCNDDFNSLGSDLVSEDYMDVNKYSTTDGVQAGYFETGAVATNGLLLNKLGVFENPNLGTSEYHFVTQLALESYATSFGDSPVIDSVFLYVPYFSTLETTQSDGKKIYTLDSISGTGTFDLKVYENNYFMASFDPNTTDGVRYYYSDDKPKFDNNHGSLVLNNSNQVSQNQKFKFSNEEIYIFKRNANGQLLDKDDNVIDDSSDFEKKVVLESFAPGMWLDLDKNFFQSKIFNANSSDISTAQNFVNYFRGLYFNVTKDASSNGALANIDFSKGYIQINYSYKNEDNETLKNTLKINLSGQTVNLIENKYNNLPQQTADKLLVVGGGKGSESNSTSGIITYIDLFGPDAGNGIPYQIDYLKNQNWLINEANVTIYVDRNSVVNSDYEPQRLFLYDLNNNSVLIDYSLDTSTNTTDISKNKAIYSGILVKQDEKGLYYKFRITEYVKSLISNQTPISESNDKYRLGLSVAENISVASFNYLFNSLNPLGIKQIPTTSVMSSLGTVLYSPNTSEVDKRIKLEVYYTNPN
jgi:hypothetical protein